MAIAQEWIIINKMPYIKNNKSYPSVTQIISATMSEEKLRGLAKWRAELGAKADEISNFAMRFGTLFHKAMYHMLTNKPLSAVQDKLIQQSEELVAYFKEKKLETFVCEQPVYYKELYAGTADLVGFLDGKLTIIDFKTSSKLKLRRFLDDYFLQLAAYAQAVDDTKVFGEQQVEQGLIVLNCFTKQPFIFAFHILDANELAEYKVLFNERLKLYYERLL